MPRAGRLTAAPWQPCGPASLMALPPIPCAKSHAASTGPSAAGCASGSAKPSNQAARIAGSSMRPSRWLSRSVASRAPISTGPAEGTRSPGCTARAVAATPGVDAWPPSCNACWPTITASVAGSTDIHTRCQRRSASGRFVATVVPPISATVPWGADGKDRRAVGDHGLHAPVQAGPHQGGPGAGGTGVAARAGRDRDVGAEVDRLARALERLVEQRRKVLVAPPRPLRVRVGADHPQQPGAVGAAVAHADMRHDGLAGPCGQAGEVAGDRQLCGRHAVSPGCRAAQRRP